MRNSSKVLVGFAVVAVLALVALPRTAGAQACPQPPTSVGKLLAAGSTDETIGSTGFRLSDFSLGGRVHSSLYSWGSGIFARFGTRSSVSVLRERRGLMR